MQEFPKAEIEHWRDEFVRRGYDQRVADLDSRRIDYFVMPVDIFR